MEKILEKPDFLFVGNNTAVDFINTEMIFGGSPLDLLENSSDVMRWMKAAGLFASGTVPRNLSDEARAYRAQLREGMARLAKGSRISASLLDSTNAYLARRSAWQKLEPDKGGYRVTTVFQPKLAADYMLPIAQAFATLLSSSDLARVRKCANPECVLYYYDTSKGGHRSWCSLDLCGNKLRMAASRARRSLSA